jgi:hypothetical protein
MAPPLERKLTILEEEKCIQVRHCCAAFWQILERRSGQNGYAKLVLMRKA